MSLGQFIQKWTIPEYPPIPVGAKDLAIIEQHFRCALPMEYRKAVLEFGLPHLISSLLHSIVEQQLDIRDVSDFHTADEVVSTTEGWRRAGMPSGLIAFASDCSGNKFCFDLRTVDAEGSMNPAVWFFDHDYVEVDLVAANFNAWIDAFCAIEPSP